MKPSVEIASSDMALKTLVHKPRQIRPCATHQDQETNCDRRPPCLCGNPPFAREGQAVMPVFLPVQPEGKQDRKENVRQEPGIESGSARGYHT